ncbi:hypothetical protein CR513_12847, partial [Mucuna pruriens]
MENFIKTKEYWSIIADDVPIIAEGNQLSEVQKKGIDEATPKNMKAKNYLFQAIDRSILETILNKDTTKGIYNSLKKKYQGTALNKLRLNKAKIKGVDVIEKILQSMTPKFNYVVCSLKKSKNLDVVTIDELQSSLFVHEQQMKSQILEEQALKVATRESSRGRGRGTGGMRGRGRSGGRCSFDKSTIECYHCHKTGHFRYECPSKGSDAKANYVEGDDEMLLMAYLNDKEASNKKR